MLRFDFKIENDYHIQINKTVMMLNYNRISEKGVVKMGWGWQPGWRWVIALAVPLMAAARAQADGVFQAAGGGNDPSGIGAISEQNWALHGQFTNTYQWHPAFSAPYNGANSLPSGTEGEQTNDATLYAGYRLSPNSEIWINAEYDQGFGLAGTLGVAGFPSGEAYKVGADNPYYRTPRLFYRKVINLGGEQQQLSATANQFAGSRTADNLTLTIGKFAVTDIFDNNSYAHDPRNDFLNWAAVDAGAFDYAADAWGYTYGAAIEWSQSSWTWRNGVFDLSQVPNSEKLTQRFSQFELVSELEKRYQLNDHPGKIRFLVFDNRGRMGSYADAIAQWQQSGQPAGGPSTALVRRYASRPGAAINIEQAVTSDLGLFARLSANNGNEETYEFTDINQSAELGASLNGSSWGRASDNVGGAMIVNGISSVARAYFADGGLGVLVGDGQLQRYATEQIAEFYYAWQALSFLTVTADYQYVRNPAYNADRGPVNIFAMRVHLQY